MHPDPNGPADTRGMGIVHSALRRDLERARLVLTSGDATPAREAEIGRHLVWMMHFLHVHHTQEDEQYWPATLERAPEAADLLQAMEDEHVGLVEPIATLEREAAALAGGEGSAAATAEAVSALQPVLNAHLRHEELEMLPVVAAAWTHAEHEEFEKEHILGPKSVGQLLHEGMWVTDNATDEVREHIFAKAGWVLRFILAQTVGRAYEKKKRLMWAGTPAWDLAPITVEQAPA